MDKGAREWIEQLGLRRHPEGGFFREIYRSEGAIPAGALPERYGSERSFSTAIYFLLPGDEISAFHRLQSDELWFFHVGAPILIYVLCADGGIERKTLGAQCCEGQTPMCVLERGKYFAAELGGDKSFSLVSCVVAPGFEFADFELAEREQLLRDYPEHHDIIQRLTWGS